jgi:hypothetical protein
MTLLLARQCRVLGAPRGAAGAWQRLRCPALVVPAPARAYHPQNDAEALHKQESGTKLPQYTQSGKSFTIRKFFAGEKPVGKESLKKGRTVVTHIIPTHYNKQERARAQLHKERSHFVTPSIVDSKIVPVNSAILVPASITAAVSVPAPTRT